MALRSFADSRGTTWDVWEVTSYAVRDLESPAEEAAGNLVAVPGAGWLCFQCAGEKRRLAPIPRLWAELPPHALAELLLRAEPVRRRRRPSSADPIDG